MTTSVGAPPSLQERLAPYALSREEDYAAHGPLLSLTSRLLGIAPRFASLAHLSRPTIGIYQNLLRSCFRIPAIDFGLSPVSPTLRKDIVLLSSLRHGCVYCASHCAVLGDAASGSLKSQLGRLSERKLPNVDPLRTSNVPVGHKEVIALVHSVCSSSHNVTEKVKQDVVDALGEDGYHHVVSVLCFMGWLNHCMDALGMRVEKEIAPFAGLLLKDILKDVQIADYAEKEQEPSSARATEMEAIQEDKFGMLGRLTAFAKNAWELLGLLPTVLQVGWSEIKAFNGIPSDLHAIDDWIQVKIGVLPRFATCTTDVVLKRALCYGIREHFVWTTTSKWSLRDKCQLLYIYSVGAQNTLLKEDAVQLAANIGRTLSDDHSVEPLRLDFESMEAKIRSGKTHESARLSAAARFVHRCAGQGDKLTENIVNELTACEEDPAALVELAGLIAWFGFLHRTSLLLIPCKD